MCGGDTSRHLALQEQFTGMRDLYVRNGQGFILVYSVNDRESLDELLEIRNMIVRMKPDAHVGPAGIPLQFTTIHS